MPRVVGYYLRWFANEGYFRNISFTSIYEKMESTKYVSGKAEVDIVKLETLVGVVLSV